jgi:outer membrane protein OmpA-like peptidoglycan-associated protein
MSSRPAPAVVEAPEPAPAVVAPPPPVVTPEVVVAIEDLAQKYPGLFVYDRARGMLRFSSDITFDSGSSVVKPQARAALDTLAQILNREQVKDRRMTVIGHTDSDRVRKPETIARLKGLGKPADNQGLSEARAEAVAEVLRQGGIDPGRIVTSGKGQTQPISDNASAAGKASNRRVEIFLSQGGPAGSVGFSSGQSGM